MRSIYDNPYKYACECDIPIELAKIACLKERHLRKEQKKHKPKCPNCGSKKLDYEMGSYEEGYGDYFECVTCGETYDPNEIKNIEYMPCPFGDFDVVLYFRRRGQNISGWDEACGATTMEEWQAFARKEIVGK